jgi:hypothetical protein
LNVAPQGDEQQVDWRRAFSSVAAEISCYNFRLVWLIRNCNATKMLWAIGGVLAMFTGLSYVLTKSNEEGQRQRIIEDLTNPRQSLPLDDESSSTSSNAPVDMDDFLQFPVSKKCKLNNGVVFPKVMLSKAKPSSTDDENDNEESVEEQSESSDENVGDHVGAIGSKKRSLSHREGRMLRREQRLAAVNNNSELDESRNPNIPLITIVNNSVNEEAATILEFTPPIENGKVDAEADGKKDISEDTSTDFNSPHCIEKVCSSNDTCMVDNKENNQIQAQSHTCISSAKELSPATEVGLVNVDNLSLLATTAAAAAANSQCGEAAARQCEEDVVH